MEHKPTESLPAPPTTGGARKLHVDVVDGDQAGATWVGDGRCAIGSHPSNQLVIEDATVSRFHCELWADGDRVHVRDLGSRNATRLGSTELAHATVVDGSKLALGNTTIRVRIGNPGQPVEPSPARDRFGPLVGRSAAMQALFAALEKVAASDATALVEGETGTGKEGVAEAIHAASARRDRPFVVLDCAAIPPTLIEAHLFGHEQGAFTGANAPRIGVFEEADGGTLFLDELGELPLDLQPRLLRALESRSVRRVGGRTQKRVDVRLIAATNRDLRAAVNDGGFRADLYYRLAVVRLRVPPLRERPEDISLLVAHFLETLGASRETRALLEVPDVLDAFARAPWPGNVRELRNHVESCAVFQEAQMPGGAPPAPARQEEAEQPELYEQAKRRAVQMFDRGYLVGLLRAANGNIALAARLSGLNRAYLYRLLDRYELR